MKVQLITLALMAALLAGCASLSESECRSADWQRIGYEDAAGGRPQGRSVAHSKACAEYGLGFDEQAYFSGYERGLPHYCNNENAVRIGLEGARYAGVCPLADYPTFESRYRVALLVYEQRQRLLALENRWRSLEYELDHAEDDQQRRTIRAELYRLDRELRAERDRLYYAEEQLRRVISGST